MFTLVNKYKNDNNTANETHILIQNFDIDFLKLQCVSFSIHGMDFDSFSLELLVLKLSKGQSLKKISP